MTRRKTEEPQRRHWLMKSEPDSYGIRDLERDGKTGWDGVRNYQARNIMRDEIHVGDAVLIYHTDGAPGVAGVARVCGRARPDPTQWEPKSDHYDAKSTQEDPTWVLVDVEFVATFTHFVGLDALKTNPELRGLMVTKKGQRLSIQPVSEEHFRVICKMGGLRA
jgi:predicted RNA-binding protein with PUA-like domain